MTLSATPGQTVGPFFGFALPYPGGSDLVRPGSPGAVRLHGRVLDGHGAPVPDALLELWQANPDGEIVCLAGSLNRDGSAFTGWGRAATDNAGQYSFTTVAPGRAASGALAFFALTVFARGLLDRLFTRCYLPASATELAADRLLATIEPERRSTLVATADAQGFVFDVVLQGERETVFLDHTEQP
jgi:protocatechuate 3,4-dioxygenase, alpha subunit